MEKSSGCFKCIVMVFYKSGRENGGHREMAGFTSY
jgi:hypothetical protein